MLGKERTEGADPDGPSRQRHVPGLYEERVADRVEKQDWGLRGMRPRRRCRSVFGRRRAWLPVQLFLVHLSVERSTGWDIRVMFGFGRIHGTGDLMTLTQSYCEEIREGGGLTRRRGGNVGFGWG